MNNEFLICGVHPLREAVLSGKSIEKVFLQKDIQNPQINDLKALIREKHIPMQFVPVEKLNRMTKTLHQGVIGLVSMISYVSLEDEMEKILAQNDKPFLLMLDRVSDVRNMGAIVRTAECAGVQAVIIPDAGSAQINSDSVKTSAGALLRVPVCKVSNLKSAIHYLKACGLNVFAATEKGAENYTQSDYTKPCVIIMGAEEDGVSKDLLKLSDELVRIPLQGEIESLNVSVAAGVLLYEVVRQRNL